MKKIAQLAMVASLIVPLMACSGFDPKTTTRGNLPTPSEISKISVGSTKQQVLDVFGPPLSIGAFDNNTWIYMKRQTESHAFFTPKITKYKLLALRLKDGKVAEIAQRTVNDLRNPPKVNDKTPGAAPEPSWLDEVLGNIGRFNRR